MVIALFIRFVVAILKSSRASTSAEQNARVRQAIQAMRMRPPPMPGPPPAMPGTVAYQPPAAAPAPAPPPAPLSTPPLAPAPDADPDEADPLPANGILGGPQLVDLTPDQQRRVLEFMEQGYEVMAVRLVCDETRAGILDAQKTVRTLAGLPSPY